MLFKIFINSVWFQRNIAIYQFLIIRLFNLNLYKFTIFIIIFLNIVNIKSINLFNNNLFNLILLTIRLKLLKLILNFIFFSLFSLNIESIFSNISLYFNLIHYKLSDWSISIIDSDLYCFLRIVYCIPYQYLVPFAYLYFRFFENHFRYWFIS